MPNVRFGAQRLPDPPDRTEPDPSLDMLIPLLAPAAAADQVRGVQRGR